jgi:hypothetical protein
MIIFHKQGKLMRDEWYERLPSVFVRGLSGKVVTVTIIVFGVISFLIGAVLLSLGLAQQ